MADPSPDSLAEARSLAKDCRFLRRGDRYYVAEDDVVARVAARLDELRVRVRFLEEQDRVWRDWDDSIRTVVGSPTSDDVPGEELEATSTVVRRVLNEVRADRDRLDWLHQHLIDRHESAALRTTIGATEYTADGETPIHTLVFTIDGQRGYETLREMIDACIAWQKRCS